MKNFNTTLLREKFTIQKGQENEKPLIALSNRIQIDLPDEPIIVRAQNMHGAVRMAARIIDSYNTDGSLLTRGTPVDWRAFWDSIAGDFEREHNQNRWIAIYNGGRCIYAAGDYHPFFDIIEKCQISNRGDYERSIPMAEENYRQTGEHVKIQYECNVALSVYVTEKNARFGVIVRGPLKTTTFNFTAAPKAETVFSQGACLTCAAAFLEGIQLAFTVGGNQKKLAKKLIETHSPEQEKTAEARRRLGFLKTEITEFEKAYNVHYRPERPDFQEIITEAKQR
jgi:hypothetical protein